MTSNLKTISTVIIGFGQVSQALAHQLIEAKPIHADRYGINFNIIACCDSSAVVWQQHNLSPLTSNEIQSLIQHKQQKSSSSSTTAAAISNSFQHHPLGTSCNDLSQITNRILTASTSSSSSSSSSPIIFVDCSATSQTSSVLAQILSQHSQVGIVMANKKPMSDNWSIAQTFLSNPFSSRVGIESTVGAGTPFLSTLNRLIASGDEVIRIEGTFSGTLGYVVSELQKGTSYSDAVTQAKNLGYTEPDPRDDLSGTDVARKALIMSRCLGAHLELSDVHVVPLLPAALSNANANANTNQSLTVDQFMQVLPQYNDEFKAKNVAAQAEGKVLRYVASVERKIDQSSSLSSPSSSLTWSVRVGLQAVPQDTALGRLSGTDNLAAFYTRIYHHQPLVVQGAGAGATVTAAGIIADMVHIAQHL